MKPTTLSSHVGGRPRKWSSVEELETLIENYFNAQDTVGKPPTIAGLALALGAHRATLQRYIAGDEADVFCDILKMAKLRVEEFHEARLANSSCSGSIFWLKANAGYVDRMVVERERGPEIEMDLDENITVERMSDQELRHFIAQNLTAEELTELATKRGV